MHPGLPSCYSFMHCIVPGLLVVKSAQAKDALGYQDRVQSFISIIRRERFPFYTLLWSPYPCCWCLFWLHDLNVVTQNETFQEVWSVCENVL